MFSGLHLLWIGEGIADSIHALVEVLLIYGMGGVEHFVFQEQKGTGVALASSIENKGTVFYG